LVLSRFILKYKHKMGKRL